MTVESIIDTSPLNRGLRGKDWTSNPRNVAIQYPDGGAVLFDHEGGGMYEAHVQLKARGKEAIQQGVDACKTLFEKHGASVILGLTPVDLRAARFFARKVGFKSLGTVDTEDGPCELFQMIRDDLI